jgi:hypothetical protein
MGCVRDDHFIACLDAIDTAIRQCDHQLFLLNRRGHRVSAAHIKQVEDDRRRFHEARCFILDQEQPMGEAGEIEFHREQRARFEEEHPDA